MSPVSITWRRTIGFVHGQFSTAAAVTAFLAATAVAFAFSLGSAEGGRLPLAVIWASSLSPILPALSALLSMDVWSSERQSGRIGVLLSTSVRERDYVFGKFLGVTTLTLSAVVFSLVSTLVSLAFMAPAALDGVSVVGVLPAVLILTVQGTLWCALSVMTSVWCSHSAIAAILSVILSVGVPRALWFGFMSWSAAGRASFGEMPLDAHVVDFASGVVSLGTIMAYIAVTGVLLFIATKSVAALRLVGRKAAALRNSTTFAIILSLVAAALAALLSSRVDMTLDCPQVGLASAFSPRTRNILAESSGDITVTCYLSRNDPRFRAIGQFLRRLRREALSQGGVRIELRFIDPNWDVGPANRLAARGVSEESLVFEKSRRMAIMPLKDGFGERVCAAAIRRLVTPPQRRSVYWTCGHGENAFDGYGAFGMSDIARDLNREGYSNRTLDLTQNHPIPGDCALVIVAGMRTEFSRAELERIDTYLRDGGRLLVLMNSFQENGIASLLTAWGLRPVSVESDSARTLTGSEIVVTLSSSHTLASPLCGSRLVMERPIAFLPSSAASSSANGADHIGFTPLATVGSWSLAAVAERGVGAGKDLTIRPTRIIAIGDATFVMNGQLAVRANANRDFFLNCVAYLSGTDAYGSSGAETDLLVVGMDRARSMLHLVVTAGVVPSVVFLALMSIIVYRRRRT